MQHQIGEAAAKVRQINEEKSKFKNQNAKAITIIRGPQCDPLIIIKN